MPNESRPRRENSGTSRLRKPASPASPPESEETAGPSSTPPPTYPGTEEAPSPVVESSYRDPPRREEGPADREPIRFVREREPLRERIDREPGMSIRERLARECLQFAQRLCVDAAHSLCVAGSDHPDRLCNRGL